MKKFDFKLEKLLEIRKRKEEQQLLILSKVSGEYQMEVNKKNSILSQIKDERIKLHDKRYFLTLEDLKDYDEMTKRGDLAIFKLDEKIEEKRKKMQIEVDKYTAAKRDRRAVEILKEKALKKYNYEVLQEERKDIDEISRNLYLQNKDRANNSENNI
jgi:flagellar protein FliJ